MNRSDQQLISDYLSGDEKSLEILIQRYLKSIYSFIYRYVGNAQGAEDITQETFIKVWRNLKKPAPHIFCRTSNCKYVFKKIFDSDRDARARIAQPFMDEARRPKIFCKKCVGFDPNKGSFRIWIFQIAKNTAIDYLKKKKAIPFSEFENEKGENTIAETLADDSPLPAELFDKKQTAQMLNAAMEKLSPQYRMVLFLRYNDHFTFQEIADIFGEPLNTVKSRHRRAILLLKKLLKAVNK